LSPEQLEKIGESAKRIKELPIYIDSCFTADIGYLDTTIRKYRQLHNIDTVYVDYVQLMAERNEQSTHEIGRISRRLKLLANELGIGAVLLSQLNREVEHRDDRRPIMSDLRQSGNLEEDADLIAGLYRDEYYFKDSPNKGTIEFIIRKQRNGPIGTIYLNFVDTTNVVTDKVVIKSDN
jgi:replicative DNA helicase